MCFRDKFMYYMHIYVQVSGFIVKNNKCILFMFKFTILKIQKKRNNMLLEIHVFFL
jgi:hypothetical protein